MHFDIYLPVYTIFHKLWFLKWFPWTFLVSHKLPDQWFLVVKVKIYLWKFYGCHQDLDNYYGWSIRLYSHLFMKGFISCFLYLLKHWGFQHYFLNISCCTGSHKSVARTDNPFSREHSSSHITLSGVRVTKYIFCI